MVHSSSFVSQSKRSPCLLLLLVTILQNHAKPADQFMKRSNPCDRWVGQTETRETMEKGSSEGVRKDLMIGQCMLGLWIRSPDLCDLSEGSLGETENLSALDSYTWFESLFLIDKQQVDKIQPRLRWLRMLNMPKCWPVRLSTEFKRSGQKARNLWTKKQRRALKLETTLEI